MALQATLIRDTKVNGSPLQQFVGGLSVEQFFPSMMTWPKTNLPVSDYQTASQIFANPTDEESYLNSPSDSQETMLPFSMHFQEPYVFRNLPSNEPFQGLPRSIYKPQEHQTSLASRNSNQRESSAYQMHDGRNRKPHFSRILAANIESPNLREFLIRPSEMLRITKPSFFQLENRHRPSDQSRLNVPNSEGRLQPLQRTRHFNQQHSGVSSRVITIPNQSYETNLKIPGTIRLLPFPKEVRRNVSIVSSVATQNLPEEEESPQDSKELNNKDDDAAADSRQQRNLPVFGQRKPKIANKNKMLTITHPTYQNVQEDKLKESETTRLTAREGHLGDRYNENFMPSQYVIDLKFRKSDNLAGRSPEAMRSKGFTETHHRLVERFEEIHQHGETGSDSGHRSNKEHYKNEGYHGSSDDSSRSYRNKNDAGSGKYSGSKHHHHRHHQDRAGAKNGRHHSASLAKHLENSSNRRETMLSAPSGPQVLDDQSTDDLPPVSFGKPPIKVPTLLNGRGSSRGAPYTVAYRGPHEEDVHPPIPSRDFRVNDKFRKWATSQVSIGGGLH